MKKTPIAPKENFSRGLYELKIPELGKVIKGKVRDSWVVKKGKSEYRIMVTTDRQSAYDAIICTIPGKGQVLNLISAYWFQETKKILPNHMVAIPQPNILIARQAKGTLPVEVVVRAYMAKSSTTTSVYYNYTGLNRRNIYGINFPDGLKANQELPMGTIITATTKAEAGHDEELTDEKARKIVDGKLGKGTWEKAKKAALKIFEMGRKHALSKGLILVDTKYEFGIDEKGKLMLIDEVHTPDSSRYWLKKTYKEKFKKGLTPDTFDKEILRRWLVENGFSGNGKIPKVDKKIVDAMVKAYATPYEMIVGKKLPTLNLKISHKELVASIKKFL